MIKYSPRSDHWRRTRI